MRRIFLIGILVFIAILFSACEISGQHVNPKNMSSNQMTGEFKKTLSGSFFEKKQIHSLSIEKSHFSTVCDWLDNENILYIAQKNGKQNIYKFNIYTGKSDLFYSSASQIVSVSANQDHSFFVIRTSPTTYEAGLIILDKNGHEVFNWKVGSYDLLITWNPYIKDQLYITTFLADWSFQTYLLDAKSQSVAESNLPIPFIQWVDRKDIAYLKWNENEPGFSAPLYEVNLSTKKEQKIFDKISFFNAFQDSLMTVTAENKVKATYTFYDLNLKDKISEFSMPILAKYSEWFIPEFDYVEKKGVFYTFRPYKSGNYDEYHDKYDLISFSLRTGTENVVLANLDHKPIKFSPNGKLCLYGYYLENIINMDNSKITPLIQFS